MGSESKIEWTERTWNPTSGRSTLSTGGKHCYAEVMAKRLKDMGEPGYANGFNLTLLPKRLAEPRQRNKTTIYFVNAMSAPVARGHRQPALHPVPPPALRDF